MGDVVSLHGPQIDLASDLGRELIVDLSRFYEELLSEAAIRKKYRFDDKTWEQLGSDDKLVEMFEDEKIRRIRDGGQGPWSPRRHHERPQRQSAASNRLSQGARRLR